MNLFETLIENYVDRHNGKFKMYKYHDNLCIGSALTGICTFGLSFIGLDKISNEYARNLNDITKITRIVKLPGNAIILQDNKNCRVVNLYNSKISADNINFHNTYNNSFIRAENLADVKIYQATKPIYAQVQPVNNYYELTAVSDSFYHMARKLPAVRAVKYTVIITGLAFVSSYINRKIATEFSQYWRRSRIRGETYYD